MTYKQFLEKIKQGVCDFMGGEVEVIMSTIMKNNGIFMDGLSIIEDGKNISPTIYINGYYEEYKQGKSISSIIYDIVAIYEDGKLKENINVEFFVDYEKVKTRIVFKLINYKKNKKLLEQVPHRKFLDLAVVYYCIVLNDVLGNATILVYNAHKTLWNITEEDLYKKAKENTPNILGVEFKSMEEIIEEVLTDELHKKKQDENAEEELKAWLTETFSKKEEKGSAPMYVLTNKTRIFGASCLLYENILEVLGKKINHDYYILPSSIHEVIIVPSWKEEDPEMLKNMVKDVNTNQVEVEEVLSDEIYYYSREKGELDKL